jgi:hypothetical protein
MSTQNIDIILSAEDNATKAIQSADESVKKLTKSMGTSSKFGGTMQSAIDSASQSLQKIGVVSGIAGAGLTGVLGSTVRSATELENSLKGLQSIVVGTGGDFNSAKGIIQKFTADGLVSTAEAATSLKNLIAKGFSLDQAEEMMNRFKDAASFGRQAAL